MFNIHYLILGFLFFLPIIPHLIENCIRYQQSDTDFQCITCKIGYTLIKQKCVNCEKDDSSDQCTDNVRNVGSNIGNAIDISYNEKSKENNEVLEEKKINEILHLLEGKEKRIIQSFITSFQEILKEDKFCIEKNEQKCVKCADGYEISFNDTCMLLNEQILEGCLVYSMKEQKCLQCSEQIFSNNGTCNFSQFSNIKTQTFRPANSSLIFYKEKTELNSSTQQTNIVKKKLVSEFGRSNEPILYPKDFNLTEKELEENNMSLSIQQFPFCLEYRNDTCYKCQIGYLLNKIVQKCLRIKQSLLFTPVVSEDEPELQISKKFRNFSPINKFSEIKNCAKLSEDQTKCQQCRYRFYYNKSTRQCEAVNFLCKEWNKQDGTCTKCYFKYSLVSGKCIKLI